MFHQNSKTPCDYRANEKPGKTHELVRVDTPQAVLSALDEDVAVLMLTHVNYRNGFRHDMAALTAAAHAVGALVIWDLAHSAGAMPLELAAARVDFLERRTGRSDSSLARM